MKAYCPQPATPRAPRPRPLGHSRRRAARASPASLAAAARVDTPLHASALLALTQLLGIHAAAEARGELPPAWLLETRVAHACGVLGLPAAAAAEACRGDGDGGGGGGSGAAVLERLLFVNRGATPEQAVGGRCPAKAG
jgi:hypothetical protein